MLYRNICLALSCVFALSAVQSSFAQDRAAMESYACNYVEGKGLDDLMAVAAKWDKWASDNNPAPYRAYVLTPIFATFEEVPEAVWIGFSPTSAQLGAVADTWLSEGGDLIAEFDSVVKCGAHPAHVQGTGGAGRKTDAYVRHARGNFQRQRCRFGAGWTTLHEAQFEQCFLTHHGLVPGGIKHDLDFGRVDVFGAGHFFLHF